MKFRPKPKKPENPICNHDISVKYLTVSQINELVKSFNADPDNVIIEVSEDDDNGYIDVDAYVSLSGLKYSPEDFSKMEKSYETRLKAYNKWYYSNKTAIDAELERRNNLKKLTETKRKEKELKSLLKQQQEIEKG